MIKLSNGNVFALPCTSVKSFAIKAEHVQILHPNWNNAMSKIIAKIQQEFSWKEFKISAELDQLVVLAADNQHMKLKTSKGFAQLVVQLPSICTGGELLLGESKHVCPFGKNPDEKSSENIDFDCSYACFYRDYDRDFSQVIHGSRTFLVYNLIWNENVAAPSFKNSLSSHAEEEMRKALKKWKCKETAALYPFGISYKIEDQGSKAFSGVDAQVFTCIKNAANSLDLELYLLSCRKKEIQYCENENYDSDCDYGWDFDESDWDSHENEHKQTWFSLEGKKLNIKGKLNIDTLLDTDLIFLQKNPGEDFWGEIVDKDYNHEKGGGITRTLKFCKNALLICPKKNVFKVLLYNSDFDFSINALKKFDDVVMDSFFSFLKNISATSLRLEDVGRKLFSNQLFLDALKFE
jgi:hypothetical protein